MRGYQHITTKNIRNTIKVSKLKNHKISNVKREVYNAKNNIEMDELPNCCWWECKSYILNMHSENPVHS